MNKLSKKHKQNIRNTILISYKNGVKMGFQKGHVGFNTGFKKGNIPWNKIKRNSKKCKGCKKIFEVPKNRPHNALTCSKKCQYVVLSRLKPWNKNKKTGIKPKTTFKKGQIPWNKGLTKEDSRILKTIETRRKTDNYKHTEKTKRKIRKARAKQKFPFNNTKIEVILQKALSEENIKYETQKYSLPGTPDIFIEPNICIFADGDYWHNIPGSQEKDKKINKQLEEMNYVVLRFWEHEILTDINVCVKTIKNELFK